MGSYRDGMWLFKKKLVKLRKGFLNIREPFLIIYHYNDPSPKLLLQ